MKCKSIEPFLILVLITLTIPALSQQKTASTKEIPARPKLVVGIVVDQMRWDYLYRYQARYTSGGFKRLLREGFSCENTMINYLPSYTAVGHTCIFTGSVPALDGITGNDWIEELTGKTLYCTEDSTVTGVGAESEDGKMSPRNLLVSTITDELRMASNYQSKVVGVSLKDRAAILPAGHTANAAFWLDDKSGKFISSSYYMQDLPDWVKKFNEANWIQSLVAGGWNTLYPLNTYIQSDSDNQSYEGHSAADELPVFQHHIAESYQKSKGSFRSTPFGNSLTLEFAAAAVEGYKLGQGNATDFLTINCASTDYVGHQYGPNSIEVEDTYLRLDLELAKFFALLDSKLGKGNYTVFLTADHGAANAVGYSKKNRIPADFIYSKSLVDSLNKKLFQAFGYNHIVRAGMNYQIHFDLNLVAEKKLNIDSIKRLTVEYLQRQPGVQYAVDVANIGSAPIPEPLKTMIINGYNFRRSGPIQVVFDPAWLESYARTGTTHGAWNPYDTHIPLIFMGWGIHSGSSHTVVHMTDISPTLAGLLHIQMPNGCIGSPIREVLGN